MLDAPGALSEPVNEPEPLLWHWLLWAIGIHLRVLLQFPRAWWHFSNLTYFEALAGLVVASMLSKQVRSILVSLGSGHSVHSNLCLRGASVPLGESGCLGPGGLLSPCLQPWAGISGLQRLQTVISSPRIISLLEIDGYLKILKYFFSLISTGFSSSCHSSKIPDVGKKVGKFYSCQVRGNGFRGVFRGYKEFIDNLDQIL